MQRDKIVEYWPEVPHRTLHGVLRMHADRGDVGQVNSNARKMTGFQQKGTIPMWNEKALLRSIGKANCSDANRATFGWKSLHIGHS